MNKRSQTLATFVILICWLYDPPSALAQSTDPNNEIFNRIKNCVMLLDDGQTQSYGLYLARAKNKKFMYVLATDQLAIGVEGKIRVTQLNGKTENFKAAKSNTNDTLNIAIYRIASPPKQLRPITRMPQEEVTPNLSLWALGRPEVQQRAIKIRLVKPVTNLANTFVGSPIFDTQGRVLGCIKLDAKPVPPPKESVAPVPTPNQVIRIDKVLGYATKALYGLELNPIWQEVYPTQFISEQVKESVALLDTKKNGAGIFLGIDKKKTGYVLTAAHVVEGETGPFTVQFTQHRDEQIVGEAMAETIEKDLDLAIVKIPNCPEVKPVTFMRTDSVKKIERYFVKQAGTTVEYTVASIGYDDNLFWRHKFGNLLKVNDKTFENDLPLESGDSGGPVFNERGEIIGLNLKTSGFDSTQKSIVSVSVNSNALLKYLSDNLGKVEFKEKWKFYYLPSFWAKNRIWLLSASAAATGTLAGVLSSKEKKRDKLPDPPGGPTGN